MPQSRFTISKDRTVLLVCMGISLLAWLSLKLSRDYDSPQEVQLHYNLPAGRQFKETPPASLVVHFREPGRKLLLNYLFNKDFVIHIDLSNSSSQLISNKDLLARIYQETGLRAEALEINNLQIFLDATASRIVPVILDANIEYQNDFYLRDSILVFPDSATIYGTKESLQKIDYLKTENLRLVGPKTDERLSLKILKPDKGSFRLSKDSVEVLIPVEQFTEKTFMLPVRISNAKDSVQVFPNTVTLTCLVGLSHYQELNEDDFLIQADFRDWEGMTLQSYIPLVLKAQPGWVRSVSFSPKSVEFLIVE